MGPWDHDHDAARVMLDAAPNVTAILSMSEMQAIAVIDEGRRRGALKEIRSCQRPTNPIFRTGHLPKR
jgi:hypothetical protein